MIPRKIRLLLPALLSFICTGIHAQTFYRWTEFGVGAGASQYFGDLNDQYGFKHIRPAFSAFMRYHFNHYIALRVSGTYTQLGYDDKDNSNAYQHMRNLSFRTNIWEGAVQADFNFFRFETGNDENWWTPYLTGGIGAFYYNPYTFYNGDKYYLRPLGTEGQNLGGAYASRKYSNVAVCFPIGAGIKWWAFPGVNMALEITDRLTTTDYIDDVSTTYVGADKFAPDPTSLNAAYYLQDPSVLSNPTQPLGRAGKQRGNSASRDQYMMVQFQISIQLKTYKCPAYMSVWRTMY